MRLICALALALLFMLPASAQETCTNRDRLLSFLAEKYKEEPIAMGIVGGSGLMEVYVSEIGSWTISITDPKTDIACVIAAGEAWEDIEPHLLEGDPS